MEGDFCAGGGVGVLRLGPRRQPCGREETLSARAGGSDPHTLHRRLHAAQDLPVSVQISPASQHPDVLPENHRPRRLQERRVVPRHRFHQGAFPREVDRTGEFLCHGRLVADRPRKARARRQGGLPRHAAVCLHARAKLQGWRGSQTVPPYQQFIKGRDSLFHTGSTTGGTGHATQGNAAHRQQGVQARHLRGGVQEQRQHPHRHSGCEDV
mmetsp:Transcript_5487/g.13843  ORF Transcript_5487/g.13843 Transcript_5487/m.13843 type:complete len:211 (-) Transcript_5487:172-804(-)